MRVTYTYKNIWNIQSKVDVLYYGIKLNSALILKFFVSQSRFHSTRKKDFQRSRRNFSIKLKGDIKRINIDSFIFSLLRTFFNDRKIRFGQT